MRQLVIRQLFMRQVVMRQLYRSFSVSILIVALTTGIAVAQKDTTKLNQSVEVMKAYQPTITNANKVSLLPVIEDTTRFTPEFKYSIESRPVTTGFTASPIGAADVNGLPSKDLGFGYLKLGAGAYSTLYGELFLNLPKSKIATLGVHLRHLTSDGTLTLREGDIADAPYSQSNASIFSSLNLGGTVLSADLSYDRDAMRYYGYPVALPANTIMDQYGLKQAYQKGKMSVSLRTDDKAETDLKFNGGFHLGFFDSKTNQKQTSGGLFGNFDYKFGELNGILNLSYEHLITDSISLEPSHVVGTKKEGWVRVAPSVRLDGDNWSLRGGINFVAVQDKSYNNVTKLYPDFEANLTPLAGILTLYASFKGDLKNNRYGDIAMENYWADPMHNVHNTDYSYVLSGGMKGKISREISYNLGLKYIMVKDQYFYILNSHDNSSSSSSTDRIVYNNAFDMIYDNLKIFNLSTEFSYVSGNDLSVVLKGNYYNYRLDNLPFAPQRPNFEMSASTGFRIIERLKGFADLEVLGNRKALTIYTDPITQSKVNSEFTIDPSIRVNLGATYELTSKFNLFGRVDNLLNRENEQWLGYASQGIRLLAGASYTF